MAPLGTSSSLQAGFGCETALSLDDAAADDANCSVANNTCGYIDGFEEDSAVDSQFGYTTPEFADLTAEVGHVFKDDGSGAVRWVASTALARLPWPRRTATTTACAVASR